MLQSRRVFDISNIITNYAFLVCLFLFALYVASFWFNLEPSFITFIVNTCAVLCWTVFALSVVIFFFTLFFWIADEHLHFSLIIWTLLRAAICIFLIYALGIFYTITTTGFEVHI